MPKSYSIGYTGANASASFPHLAAGHTVASPTSRPRVFEFEIGSSGTPADYASRFNISRLTTAAPTGGSTPTAAPLDPGDPATTMGTYAATTGGCTLGSSLMLFGLNQRATFRWVAAPGKELIIPATQYNGIGIVIASQSSAYNVDATLFWEE